MTMMSVAQERMSLSVKGFLAHLLDDCNTRYEWLVRPYSIGTFTQSETPSFAWRTEDCPLWGALILK